jgi:hypothetical protein
MKTTITTSDIDYFLAACKEIGEVPTLQGWILAMTCIEIPATRHPSIQYGSHWAIPGYSGHYIRFNGAQSWVMARECPGLCWGTSRQALADPTASTVTLADVRSAVADYHYHYHCRGRIMNDYNKLTGAEQHELCERIADGDISRACRNHDWFNIKLSSGRTACGSYRHGSESGDYIRLAIK